MNIIVLIIVIVATVVFVKNNNRYITNSSTCEDKNSTLHFGYNPLNESSCSSDPSWRYDVTAKPRTDRFLTVDRPFTAHLGRMPEAHHFPPYPDYVNFKVCLEITFSDGPILIDKVKIRGTNAGVVSVFVLLYRNEEGAWGTVRDANSSDTTVFERGKNKCTVRSSLPEVLFMPGPIRVSGLRVYPQASQGKPMLQIDVHSCTPAR